MTVFRNDAFCIGCNSSIHKFIVILISLNQAEAEMRVFTNYIRTGQNRIDYRF